MERRKEVAGIPPVGFLKIGNERNTSLTSAQKTALIRKGNEFFNAGDIERAKRIFLTTGYSDGLMRLGDHYFKSSDPLEAFRMYWLAPALDKKEMMVERMAAIVHRWLKEDENYEK
ncbi:MAG TPA: hypothetical protein VMV68_02415 [Spirochaetia bacterium]|nr:hypothetical protein [Spirochaetia bacterium]